MFILPFKIRVEGGEADILAIGSNRVNDKPLLIYEVSLFSDVPIKTTLLGTLEVNGGEDVSEYITSSMLGEDVSDFAYAIKKPQIVEPKILKYGESGIIVNDKTGLTIPSEYAFAIRINTLEPAILTGNIVWDIPEINEEL